MTYRDELFFLIGVAVGAIGMAMLTVPAKAQVSTSGGSVGFTTSAAPLVSMAPSSCWIASMAQDGEVTVDWPCAEKLAASNSKDTAVYYARVMLAIRDGKARTR